MRLFRRHKCGRYGLPAPRGRRRFSGAASTVVFPAPPIALDVFFGAAVGPLFRRG
jgi:hypothetical protein